MSDREFSSIQYNPFWQAKKFAPQKARYIKLRAQHNVNEDNGMGYAEIDVITQ